MAGDIARLVLEIDSTGAVTGKVNLEALTRAGKESEDQVKKQKVSFTELNQAVELGSKIWEKAKSVITASNAEFREAEKANLKIQAILRATGESAGKTGTELEQMADSLSRSTAIDDDLFTNAQALILTFKGIRGEIYDRTLPAVADLAQAFDMTLSGAAVMLGKALEDPQSGLTALRRVGVSFSESEREVIQSMVDAGEAAKAQAEILRVLEGQVGGVAELYGSSAPAAIDRMTNSIGNLNEAIGRLTNTNFKPVADGIASIADLLARTINEASAYQTTAFTSPQQGALLGKLDTAVSGLSGARTEKDRAMSLATVKSLLSDLQATGYNFDQQLAAWKIRTEAADRYVRDNGFDFGESAYTNKVLAGMKAIEAARTLAMKPQSGQITSLPGMTIEGVLPNFSALVGLLTVELPGIESEASLLIDRLSKAAVNTPSYNRDFDLGVGGIGSQIAAGQDSAAFGMGLDLNAKINAAADYNEGILRIIDSTSEWNLSMQSLALTMDRVDLTMQNITAQGISRGFEDIGAALASGADAGQAFGSAMLQMGVDMAKQVGQLLITAGLKMLIETTTLNPVAWSMIAMGGGLAMAGGAVGAATRGDGAASALRSSSSSSGLSSNGQTSVVIKDYAGVGIKVTERQTPSGKELQIAVRNIVAGEVASGSLDRVMGARFGLATPGRSVS